MRATIRSLHIPRQTSGTLAEIAQQINPLLSLTRGPLIAPACLGPPCPGADDLLTGSPEFFPEPLVEGTTILEQPTVRRAVALLIAKKAAW
jgi:hypothetical protein